YLMRKMFDMDPWTERESSQETPARFGILQTIRAAWDWAYRFFRTRITRRSGDAPASQSGPK
ncbi:MAG TPA: hypothetical protein VF813_10080, partial [Anaerolineaceae bacterium]